MMEKKWIFCALLIVFSLGLLALLLKFPSLVQSGTNFETSRQETPAQQAQCREEVQLLNTTYPFIGNDLFLDFADTIYSPSHPLIFKNGSIIFLHAENMTSFAKSIDSIQTYFVLITRSNNDDVVPYLSSQQKKGLRTHYEKILGCRFMISWFASNPVLQHPKITPLPLGSKWQWITPSWHGEDMKKSRMVNALKKYTSDIEKNFLKSKPNLLHLALSEGTSDDSLYEPWRRLRREAVKNYNAKFRKTPIVVVDFPINKTCAHASKHHEQTFEWEKYMLTLSTFKFVLSPPGRGPDVHRTWEALLMGSIPVVQSGPLDFLYFDLPVLTVDKWDELSKELLTSMYPILTSRSYKFDKLFAPYWMELINEKRSKFIH